MRFQKIANSLLLFNLIVAPPVLAEGDPLIFVDVFGGYQWGQNQDVDIDIPINGTPGKSSIKDLEVHNGPTFGGRIGSWLKTNPNIGIAIDATHFDSDMDQQSAQFSFMPDPTNQSGPGTIGDFRVSNTLASIDLIIRHRGERFTPYVMAGPGIMFSSIDTNGFFTDLVSPKQDDNDVSFGYKAGAGISFKLSDSMHIFTEYRYIHGSPEYTLERTTDPRNSNLVSADVEIDIDTHMVVGGVSIRF